MIRYLKLNETNLSRNGRNHLAHLFRHNFVSETFIPRNCSTNQILPGLGQGLSTIDDLEEHFFCVVDGSNELLLSDNIWPTQQLIDLPTHPNKLSSDVC